MKPGELRHYRNGPEMDVAMCTERGAHLVFSRSRGGTTCPECKERTDRSIERKSLQAARRLAWSRGGTP